MLKAIRGALMLALVPMVLPGPVGAQPAPPPETAATSPRYVMPDTISPEAAAALRGFFAMQQSGAANLFTQIPKTMAEWDARHALVEKIPMFNPRLMEKLAPSVFPETLGGVPVLRIVPKKAPKSANILIYVHGGGYTLFSARSTVMTAAQMGDAAGLTVISVDYTVAPHGTWKTATDQVLAVYSALLAQRRSPHSIGIFGDSAGGALAGGSVLKMRDRGLPLPGAVVMMSPWSDITDTGDTYRTLAGADPLLDMASLKPAADLYAAPADQKNPYVSPVYGDYSKGFPPTLIQGGTREIFLSNFVRQYRAIDDAGGTAVLDLYEGMPHVFQAMLADTPESRRAYARAGAFWRLHLGKR